MSQQIFKERVLFELSSMDMITLLDEADCLPVRSLVHTLQGSRCTMRAFAIKGTLRWSDTTVC